MASNRPSMRGVPSDAVPTDISGGGGGGGGSGDHSLSVPPAAAVESMKPRAQRKPRGQTVIPHDAALPLDSVGALPSSSSIGSVGELAAKAPPRVRTPRAEPSSLEASVTMNDGRTLTLYRRLEFESRGHAKNFIHDFALAQGKRARLDPHTSGGRNFVYVCSSASKCDFIVRGAKMNRKTKTGGGGGAPAPPAPALAPALAPAPTPAPIPAADGDDGKSGGYYITSFHADHGAECTGKAAITQRQVVNQLRIAQESAAASASSSSSAAAELTGFDVQSIVKSVHGASVPPRMAYRAKDALAGKAVATKSKTSSKSSSKSATINSTISTISTIGELSSEPSSEPSRISSSSDSVAPAADASAETSAIASGSAVPVSTDGIDKIESLLAQFQLLNPSASAQVSLDSADSFERAFLMLPHASLVQRCSPRVLGFDGMKMVSSSSSSSSSENEEAGYMLELVTKDGNNDTVVLAVALCDGLTPANFAWFFSCCVSSGLAFDVPMFCDRSNAAIASGAAEALPVSSVHPPSSSPTGLPLLVQCTQHLINTIDQRFASPQQQSNDWQKFLWRAQAADTPADFDAALSALTQANAKAGVFVKSSVDAHTWAKHCFLRKRSPLFHWQTTTLTEAENPLAMDARQLSAFEFFQKYMERSMNDLYVRKSSAKEWLAAGRALTPFAEDVLDEHHAAGLCCCVSPSDRETGTAYVWDTRSATPKKRRVNLSLNSCSCAYVDQMGLPCKHVVAAALFFNKSGASWDVRALCDRVYSVERYYEAYGQTAAIQLPVEEELASNPAVRVKVRAASVQVQTQTQAQTQAQAKQPASVGMKRCSMCHTFGHNKRNCSSNSSSNSTSTSSSIVGANGAGGTVI